MKALSAGATMKLLFSSPLPYWMSSAVFISVPGAGVCPLSVSSRLFWSLMRGANTGTSVGCIFMSPMFCRSTAPGRMSTSRYTPPFLASTA